MMIHIIIWVVILAIYYCYRTFKANNETEENEDVQPFEELNDCVMEEASYLDERTITGLVLCTLRKIGCEPKTETHERITSVCFTYQGEQFIIECNDSSQFINIYDTWWYGISIYSDVEEIANLHRTINLVNQYTSCTLLYTTNQEIEQIGVHSRRNLLFIKEIPDIDQYLICVLNDFFKSQRLVATELEKCKVREEQNV